MSVRVPGGHCLYAIGAAGPFGGAQSEVLLAHPAGRCYTEVFDRFGSR